MKDYLAIRIKLGDEQAFELLFRKYYPRLCAFANKFLNDPEEAKGVVQEVFANLWESREEIDPDNSLKSYIFKITQNISINKLRRRKVEARYYDVYMLVYVDKHEFSVHESLLARELEENISISIEKLPPECRRIFELSRIGGLKYKEIADKLDISIKTVEAQMSKALRMIRIDLREYLTAVFLLLISEFF